MYDEDIHIRAEVLFVSLISNGSVEDRVLLMRKLGQRSFGSASLMKSFMGIELITTFGTLYFSCRVRRAWRIVRIESSLMPVSVLCLHFILVDRFRPQIVIVSHSTSNQFGVITVEHGRSSRYIGITSGAT